MKLDDNNLDQLLSDHVSAKLSTQIGRTEDAFRRQLSRPVENRLKLPMWIAASLAVAAAIVWTVSVWQQHTVTTPGVSRRPVEVAKSDPAARNLQFTAYTRTVDDGLVYLDPQTPVHQLRTQEFQQVQWLEDDGKTQMKITVPKEQVLLVDYIKN
jgi:hypothetical protein